MKQIVMLSLSIWINALSDVAYPQSATREHRSLLDDFTIPEFSAFDFLLAYFPSELIGNSLRLKAYVGSKRFRSIRTHFGDLRAVDALYIRALRLTYGNSAMALLYCTLATMDHHIVGVKNPLIKAFVPLTNESWEEFTQRVDNLPAHFYADVPEHSAGDRDKLQHFFGSAFIARVFESRGAAERVGLFIEWGEDAFIVNGAYDERDMRANRQGREFGLALIGAEDLQSVLPSHFLRLWIAESTVIPESHLDSTTNERSWSGDPAETFGCNNTTPTRCGVW